MDEVGAGPATLPDVEDHDSEEVELDGGNFRVEQGPQEPDTGAVINDTFPRHAIPDGWRDYAVGEASRLGIPSGAVILPLLSSIAATMGNRWSLFAGASFTIPAILWTLVVGPPGSKKSPAMDRALEPMRMLDRRLMDAASRGAPRSRLETNDTTTEGLVRLLRDSPGLLYAHDEASGFFNSFGMYKSGGNDRQTFLKLWGMNRTIIDRATKAEIIIEKPALSITGNIQPDVLRDALRKDGGQDGMVERFLWTSFDIRRGKRIPVDIPDGLAEDLSLRLERLRAATATTLTFSANAQQRWESYRNHNDARINEAEAGLLPGYLSKLESQVGRLALVLHAARHGTGLDVVGDDTLADAIELGEHFLVEFEKLEPRFDARSTDRLEIRAERVKRELNHRGILTRTELYKALGNNAKSHEVEAVVDYLVHQGFAREEKGMSDYGRVTKVLKKA